jgi:hypothetical protein
MIVSLASEQTSSVHSASLAFHMHRAQPIDGVAVAESLHRGDGEAFVQIEPNHQLTLPSDLLSHSVLLRSPHSRCPLPAARTELRRQPSVADEQPVSAPCSALFLQCAPRRELIRHFSELAFQPCASAPANASLRADQRQWRPRRRVKVHAASHQPHSAATACSVASQQRDVRHRRTIRCAGLPTAQASHARPSTSRASRLRRWSASSTAAARLWPQSLIARIGRPPASLGSMVDSASVVPRG